jgi:hypothetical protein
MLRTFAPLALALVASVPLLSSQEEEPPPIERCPPVRHETCVRFFALKGKLDTGKLNDAVHAAGIEVAYGPMEADSRPSNSMVALTVPADMKVRDVERTLKKAKVKVEELEAFHFRGRVENGYPSFGIGLKTIDYLLGIDGDIKWCDRLENDTIFYCVEGKLTAGKLEDLFVKLQDPLGDGSPTLGDLIVDEVTWTLPEAVDESRAKKLIKAIDKLDGIDSAELNGAALRFEAPLASVVASGPAQGHDGEEPTRGSPPRVTRLTNELWDLLVEEGLTPLPTAER